MWEKKQFDTIKKILVQNTLGRHPAAADCAVSLMCGGTLIRFAAGEPIFVENEQADGIIYIIVQGDHFSLELEGEKLEEPALGPGSFLGEGAAVQRLNRARTDPMYYQFKRRATVIPKEETILLAWHWDDFRKTVSAFLGERFIDDLKELIWVRAHK